MKYILAAIASLLVCLGSIAYIVWWQLSHNFINVSCTNFIFHSKHLQDCARWGFGSGIVMGVTIPLMILGLIGTIVFAAIYGVKERDW